MTITDRFCDKFMLVLESAVQCLVCRQTKFARIVKEGVGQLRAELDIYNYMKKLRMTYAVINALTRFNQRRLLEHQVETSFLLRPLVGKKKGKGREKLDKNGKLISKERYNEMGKLAGDFSDESESEEDFEFMNKSLGVNQKFDELE